MKVKIGNTWHHPTDAPIMVVLNELEKRKIGEMPVGQHCFSHYRSGMPDEEQWLREDKPDEEALGALGDKEVLVNAIIGKSLRGDALRKLSYKQLLDIYRGRADEG